MSVSDGHMGIESQRLLGQALAGIGPDVVKPPRSRTTFCCTTTVSPSRCVRPLTAAGLRDGIEVEQKCLDLPCLESHFPDWQPRHESQ